MSGSRGISVPSSQNFVSLIHMVLEKLSLKKMKGNLKQHLLYQSTILLLSSCKTSLEVESLELER